MRDVFLSATRAHGATVRFNARVTSFDESKAQVTLENGEIITADVVVGADGVNSAMRSSIFDGAEDVRETDLVMFE
jgi:salicylate hydroxylase